MINKLKNKMHFIWKFMLLFISLISICIGLMYCFSKKACPLAESISHLPPFYFEIIKLSGVILITAIVVFIIFYIDRKLFIKQINLRLQNAFTDRGLDENFEEQFSGKSSSQILENIVSIFSLFKSFENMKINRVTSEVETLKIILNSAKNGILLVNRERLVTHINHHAETFLKLIPGEIVDQTISRKISQQELLDQLDVVLDKGKKIIEEEMELIKIKYIVSIYPVSNQLGDIVRAIVIIQQ